MVTKIKLHSLLPAVYYHGPSSNWIGGVECPEEVEEGRSQLRSTVVRPTGVVELKHRTNVTRNKLFKERGDREIMNVRYYVYAKI